MNNRLSVYARYYIPDITFLTCYTVNGEAVLDRREKAELLHEALRQTRQKLYFQLVAYVYLPDHIHLLLRFRPQPRDRAFVDLLKNCYEHEYRSLIGSPSRPTIWQRSCRRQTIHDVSGFRAYLDAIHYDAVQHKLASRPEEWPWSSYEIWMERSVYKLGWGWTKPDSIREVQMNEQNRS